MPIPPDHRLEHAPAAGLLDRLASATRRLSDGALVAAAAAGVLLATAVLLAESAWMPLALPAVAAAAFAGWGIVDRTRSDRRPLTVGSADPAADAERAAAPDRGDASLHLLERALGVAGWAALGIFLFLGFGRLFGNIVH